MPPVMTWSIVARDAATGGFGVAVASKVLAVGALCPAAEAGVGALSSQSFTNPLYRPDVLAAIRDGASIQAAIDAVTAADEGRDWRQVHGVDRAGRAFGFTGDACVPTFGMASGEGVSVAGNMLAGPEVVPATLEGWRAAWDQPFARRLVTALAAGEAAGGDMRGKQSAAILTVAHEPWAAMDLRVDDHLEPVAELMRLVDEFQENRAPYYATRPTRANPSGVDDPDAREALARGYRKAMGMEE